jgi:hypothetical protein
MIILPHPFAARPDKSEFRLLITVSGMIYKLKMRVCIVIAVIMMVSCSGKKGAGSDGVLSKAEMVKVLTEVYLTEEKVNRLSLSRDSAEKVFKIWETKIFNKTGVPDSVFRKSVNYYLDHPLQLEEVYTGLVDSLNLHEQRENVKKANLPTQ